MTSFQTPTIPSSLRSIHIGQYPYVELGPRARAPGYKFSWPEKVLMHFENLQAYNIKRRYSPPATHSTR